MQRSVGAVQTRLMRRHGLVAAACLTAIPFVLVRIPGALQNATGSNAIVDIVAIALLAPMLRYAALVLLTIGVAAYRLLRRQRLSVAALRSRDPVGAGQFDSPK